MCNLECLVFSLPCYSCNSSQSRGIFTIAILLNTLCEVNDIENTNALQIFEYPAHICLQLLLLTLFVEELQNSSWSKCILVDKNCLYKIFIRWEKYVLLFCTILQNILELRGQ